MIELTQEQRNSIRDGLPVRIDEDGNHYVLLRADVYEQLAEAGYDDSSWTAEEMDKLRADSLAALDRYGPSGRGDRKTIGEAGAKSMLA